MHVPKNYWIIKKLSWKSETKAACLTLTIYTTVRNSRRPGFPEMFWLQPTRKGQSWQQQWAGLRAELFFFFFLHKTSRMFLSVWNSNRVHLSLPCKPVCSSTQQVVRVTGFASIWSFLRVYMHKPVHISIPPRCSSVRISAEDVSLSGLPFLQLQWPHTPVNTKATIYSHSPADGHFGLCFQSPAITSKLAVIILHLGQVYLQDNLRISESNDIRNLHRYSWIIPRGPATCANLYLPVVLPSGWVIKLWCRCSFLGSILHSLLPVI